MKKMILLPLLALSLNASAMDEGQPGPGPHGDGPGMQQGMEPGKMKAALGLSDEQAKKLKALNEERKELKALRRELRDKMAALADQVDDGASESVLAASLKEIDTLQAKLHSEMMALKAERDAVLTATQRAKMLAKRGSRMEERQERREERREKRQDRKPADKE